MHNWDAGNPTLINVTFSGNSASSGGKMCNSRGGFHHASSPMLANCILWGNTAAPGAQMCNDDSSANVRYSLVQGGCPAGAMCTGNLLDADPLSADPYLRLGSGSPALDAGDNTVVPITVDLDNRPRFCDSLATCTGNGTLSIVDIGVYEFQD